MKARSILTATLALPLLAVIVNGADISGKWTADIPLRSGETRPTTFDFKVDGETLTGTVSGSGRQPGDNENKISDGKVSGETISFSVFAGPSKMFYKGKVAADAITLTRWREGRDPSPEFTLKRAK